MSWHSQPKGKGKGKGRAKAREGKERGKERDPAIAGQSVATKREAAQAAGRKGPTNSITGGSSGSCRSHAQREKQPGQRLMAVYPQRSRTLETKETTKGESGVTPDGKQTNKRKRKRGDAISLRVQLEWCVVTLGGNAGFSTTRDVARQG